MRPIALLPALSALLFVVLFGGPAAAVKIHVRGSAVIDGVVATDGEGFVVRGALTDDAGVPIVGGSVTMRAFAADRPRSAIGLPSPQICELQDGSRRARLAGADEYVIETDPRGEFCVRGAVPLPKGVVHLRYAATKLYDAAEKDADVEPGNARLTRTILRFEPLDAIDLDRPTFAVTGSLKIDRSDASRLLASASTRREGLQVVLEDERGQRLGEAATGGDGRARFEVKTEQLAGPGPGELRMRFEGSAALAKAAATQPVVRRADVTLTLTHPIETADPEDGVAIDLEVGSSRGPVSDGVVEARRGGDSIGAGPVSNGKARVIAGFSEGRSGDVPITLQYVPAAPWWRAGSALSAIVKVSGPGFVRQIVLGAVVLAIAGWVVAGWRRAPKPPAPIDEPATAPPSGRAGVQVVRASAGLTGWSGYVTDAHDGAPVVGAQLKIVVPAFDGDGVAGLATSDARGAFTLTGPHRSDARLIVESTTHSSYEQALPTPSVISVALVTRRRALIERLVRWARRQGAPFDGSPEPTPGHVRRAAARDRAAEVEEWARSIEHAAYGPDAVDEAVEEAVRQSEPKTKPKPDVGARMR